MSSNNMKEKPVNGPGNELAIASYIHCGLCIESLPAGTSAEEYQWLSVGFTKPGLQVWCVRHGCNVMHLDFAGRKLAANLTRKRKLKAPRARGAVGPVEGKT